MKGRATRASCKTREFVAVASDRTRAKQILSGIMWSIASNPPSRAPTNCNKLGLSRWAPGCVRRRLRVLHSRHLADRPTRLPRPKLGSADRLVFESVPSVDGRSAVVQIFTRRSTKRGGNPPSRPRPSARPLNAWSDRGRPTSRKGKGVRDVITNSRVPAPPNELPSFRLPIHNMSFPPLLLFSPSR